MTFTYQWSLVAFSVFIAIFASYTTLRLAFRLAWAGRQTLPYWIAGGACAMGIGIWAMHFVGMLAMHLPVPLAYDATITALSVVPAILAAAIALYVLSRPGASGIARFVASVLMGAGIVAMHYSGMAAMQMSPPIVYDPMLFALSILIAVAASWGGLFLVFRERSDAGVSFQRRLLSAVVMGLAIAGMHYTGMASAQFAPDAVCAVTDSGLSGNAIGLFVGLVAILVLAASLALTFFDEVVGENNFYRTLLLAQSDAGEGILLIENARVIYANQAMETLSAYSQTELKSLPAWTDLVESTGAELLPMGGTDASVLQKSSGRREIRLKLRDGRSRACEVVLASFRHADNTRHLLVCIDISDRKAAEEALRVREAQARELALVASRTDNAVIITDAQCTITWANEGFEKMTGYSLAEALGQKPGRLLQGQETDISTRSMIRQRLMQGEGIETEIVNYHKSGRKYWVAMDIKPVRDERGALVKFIAIERDITERKQASEILRLREMHLKEVQKLARLGSWELDLASDEYFMSEEALRIHELASATGRVPRAVVAALMHPDDVNTYQWIRSDALANRSTYSIQFRLLFPQGRIKHAHLRGTVQVDELGNPVRLVGSIQDITEQKQVEEALRLSEARLKEAQQLARLGNWELDLQSDEYLMSEEALRIHEMSSPTGRVPQSAVMALIPQEDLEKIRQSREQALACRGSHAVEFRLNLPGGRVKHLQLRGAVHMDDQGQPVKLSGSVQDITEQKLAEQALRAREAQARELALVVSGTDNGVIIMDEKARITWVNDGFTKMCGYKMEEVLGRRPGDFLNGAETDPDTLAFIKDRLERGERFETEIVHYHKSGRKYWAVIDVQTVREETGAPPKYISIERDITSRKQAEAALRLSETRLKEAQELAHIGSWEHDLASDVYIFSDEGLRIHEFALSSGRLSRQEVAAVMHPNDLNILRQRRDDALANLGTYSVEIRLILSCDRIKHVHIRGAVQADAQGNPVRVIGTVQDITEQKLAEQALLSLNETLEERVQERTQELDQQRTFTETILKSAETLIFVIDNQGRFVRFNGALERLTGYSFEYLRDQPIWASVIPPERREAVRAKHENVTSPDHLTRSLEVEWLTRTGQRRLISWSNAVLTDEAGNLKFMIGTGIDITERKRAERALIEANLNLSKTIDTLRDTQTQLVQSEKMAALGGLVAGISHEINTPIGVGVTSATALQEQFVILRRGFEDGSMKRSTLENFIAHGTTGCDILVSNLMRAAELIRSFKQVAVDQSSDEWRELDLHQYIDEIVLSLKPKLKGRKIQVINASAEGFKLHTHPGAIYQILSNLLINALLHAFDPDQAGEIRITAQQVGDEVQIDFADDGKGIPAENQGRIFDPFFTTRRGSGGSGLGLHIVYNLVASTLGGVIYLVKNVSKGTTFRIRMPMQQERKQT